MGNCTSMALLGRQQQHNNSTTTAQQQHNNNKMVRRSPSFSGLPGDGLGDRGKSEHNTPFYWIPEQARE